MMHFGLVGNLYVYFTWSENYMGSVHLGYLSLCVFDFRKAR